MREGRSRPCCSLRWGAGNTAPLCRRRSNHRPAGGPRRRGQYVLLGTRMWLGASPKTLASSDLVSSRLELRLAPAQLGAHHSRWVSVAERTRVKGLSATSEGQDAGDAQQGEAKPGSHAQFLHTTRRSPRYNPACLSKGNRHPKAGPPLPNASQTLSHLTRKSASTQMAGCRPAGERPPSDQECVLWRGRQAPSRTAWPPWWVIVAV